ncbi:MAG: aldo/keto reductase [Phycisphaerales bacterium]|nr:MAG: aldo/keto reductase [Phycisphaerales bacterium]
MTTLSLEERRAFGSTGLQVSPLGFGGAPIGLLESEQDAVRQVLNDLLDAGANVIDTAAMYRGSEAMIGETIGHRRDEYILISKCGHAIEETDAAPWSPELIRASVERSLKRLRTDVIDVMLLHSCDLETLKKREALDELMRLREEGKIRFAGYSGDNEAAAWAVTQPDVRVLQTSINLCDQNNIEHVLPAARDHEVGVMAKRPIANAAWKDAEQYERYRDYAQPYVERFKAMGLSLDLLETDGDPNLVWPEIALRFTLTVPGVHTAIVGTTRPDRIPANLEAVQKGPLPDQIFEKIRSAFRNTEGSIHWDGKT